MKPEMISDDFGSMQQEGVNYKQKYKALKKKLKFLVYEQETFVEELRKSQRKLLKVSRDRSFLLDRLLLYEKIEESSSDSEVTASSDSEAEAHKEKMRMTKKRKPTAFPQLSTINESELLERLSGNKPIKTEPGEPSSNRAQGSSTVTGSSSSGPPPRKRPKITKKKTEKINKQEDPPKEPDLYEGSLTKEEIERRLDSKKPSFSIEKAPFMMPSEIFSNDNSGDESEGDSQTNGDKELVIDLPH